MNRPFIEAVPSLVQGISRQSPSIRYPGQVADAKNVNFSVVDGARKRRGSIPLKLLSGNAGSNTEYRIHRIERDDNEEYAIVYGVNCLKVVDVNSGLEATIEGDTSYIGSASAGQIKFSTIADATFVVNLGTSARCTNDNCEEIDASTMPHLLTRESVSPLKFKFAPVNWKSRSFNRQIIKPRPGDASANWTYFNYRGSQTLPLLGDMGSEYVQKALEGNGKNPRDSLEILSEVSTSNQGITDPATGSSFSNATQYTTYPLNPYTWPPVYQFINTDPYPSTIWGHAVEGLGAFPWGKVICTGGPLNQNDVIVHFSPDIIVESLLTASPNRDIFRGDNDNDPPPPFVRDPLTGANGGIPIRDISFTRNRLCIACGEYLCFSAIDDLFNFYLEEPPTLTDSDPIVVQLAATDVSLVDYMVPFQRAMVVLTSSGQQFEMSGSETFTPSTASISPSTKYETQNVRPAQIGNRLFMVGSSADYSTLLEYVHNANSLTNEAMDLTKHVDDLVPKKALSVFTAPGQEMSFIIPVIESGTEGDEFTSEVDGDDPVGWAAAGTWAGGTAPEPWDTAKIVTGDKVFLSALSTYPGGTPSDPAPVNSKMYVHRSYTVGNERKQSAWSVWDFGADRLQDARVYDDIMVLLRKYKSGSTWKLQLDTLNLSEGQDAPSGFPWPVHLDHRQKFTGGTHSGGTTTWSTGDPEIDWIVTTGGNEYAATNSGGSVSGPDDVDLSSTTVYLGRKVAAELVLSETYPRDNSNRANLEGRVSLKKLVVGHRRSRDYTIELTTDSALSPDRNERFQSASEATTETGTKTIWVNGKNTETTIKLKSDNASPCVWVSTETHGVHHTGMLEDK